MYRITARLGILFLSVSAMACAPAMMAPTAVPMGAGKSAELGLGAMLGKSSTDSIKLVEEGTDMFGPGATGVDTHYNYQGWARFNFDEEDRSSSEMGFMGQVGAFSLLSGGSTGESRSLWRQKPWMRDCKLKWAPCGRGLRLRSPFSWWITCGSPACLPFGTASTVLSTFPWDFRMRLPTSSASMYPPGFTLMFSPITICKTIWCTVREPLLFSSRKSAGFPADFNC